MFTTNSWNFHYPVTSYFEAIPDRPWCFLNALRIFRMHIWRMPNINLAFTCSGAFLCVIGLKWRPGASIPCESLLTTQIGLSSILSCHGKSEMSPKIVLKLSSGQKSMKWVILTIRLRTSEMCQVYTASKLLFSVSVTTYGCHAISNRWHLDCLFNSLFTLTI